MLDEAGGVEARFKQTSAVAQSLAKKCDKDSTEQRLKELRRLKQRLVKLRKDAVGRQKLLRDLLPAAKSLSSGLTKISSWLDDADTMLASHCISGELVAVVERLDKHKVCFVILLIRGLFSKLQDSSSY